MIVRNCTLPVPYVSWRPSRCACGAHVIDGAAAPCVTIPDFWTWRRVVGDHAGQFEGGQVVGHAWCAEIFRRDGAMLSISMAATPPLINNRTSRAIWCVVSFPARRYTRWSSRRLLPAAARFARAQGGGPSRGAFGSAGALQSGLRGSGLLKAPPERPPRHGATVAPPILAASPAPTQNNHAPSHIYLFSTFYGGGE